MTMADVTAERSDWHCTHCGGVFESAVANFCPYCRTPNPEPYKHEEKQGNGEER